MKILFSANGFWCHTGYATPVAALLPRLGMLGHEVANFAWYGLQGGMLKLAISAPGQSRPVEVVCYPSIPDRTPESVFGVNVIHEHVAHFKADLVISVQDIWVLPPDYAQRVKSKRPECQWMCWFPVDHDPPQPGILERVPSVDWPCTYSRWGTAKMADAGKPVRYLPMGVDCSVFTPGDKAHARARLGWPRDAFMVVMVAANKSHPSRKSYPEAFEAFAQFNGTHPELNAYLYAHCQWTDADGGVNIPELARACGIYDRLFLADHYREALGLPPQYLADVYRAADVMLLPSRTEGFGIPLVEAQACGCPVITTDFASMPELTWNGLCIPPAQREWTPLGSWEVVASVERIVEALDEVATWPARFRAESAQYGVEQAQAYDWDELVERYWVPLLEEVAHAGTNNPA